MAESRGPGTWPQAGSEEPFPKAQLKGNARFICIFIYLLLTGKCNTKANYLIKALGRVLTSQTSKQISKPLFCLLLQTGAGCVGVGWETQGPFHVWLWLTLHGPGTAMPGLPCSTKGLLPLSSPSWRNAGCS